jgi:hypothetical protein
MGASVGRVGAEEGVGDADEADGGFGIRTGLWDFEGVEKGLEGESFAFSWVCDGRKQDIGVENGELVMLGAPLEFWTCLGLTAPCDHDNGGVCFEG